ncbi:cardiolipin synthase [Winogradskyella echinorum]|uniref:Cardiolipin synthase n=1 Tax=Winogradskyella echinorum TaxID=538189 RepID=A0ABR6Y310_9FLAO|nr:cardiolipin synthase [Winogradskyella echinorum]MBC3847126.1 cardiolipin synthase [Winogradskyella echinorum]MBC5751474.1 cardiolipin synthase [Winogradskyella echinorum]
MDFVKNYIWQILLGLNYILALFAVFTILLKKINPTKTLSYIIVLLVFPFVGLLVYYLFGQEYRKSKIFDRKKVLNQSVVKRIKDELELDSKTIKEVDDILHEKSKLIPLLYNSENSKLTINNAVRLIKNGDEKFKLLLEDLKNANHHIHLEYFIIKDDKIGTEVLNLLCDKAKDGVEVRIIIDDVGSSITSKMKRKIKESGIEMFSFMPVLFSKFTGQMNYRDHRKIVVIDGQIGYVGGINISDAYVNSNNDKYWRDTHIRIVGEALKSLQILFFSTWDFVSDSHLKISKKYFPDHDCKESVPLQIAASGPDTDWSNIMEAFFLAITNAENYIYITTPYFIPNDEIVTALQVAARSNIKVKIIVPKKSDSWIAEYATNSYLEQLLEAGVEVYHYTKGFVHAKTMVIDGVFGTVGTANMDYRSFNINFEINALIYNEDFSTSLNKLFEDDIKSSEKLEYQSWKNRSKRTKIIEALARLLAPLL